MMVGDWQLTRTVGVKPCLFVALKYVAARSFCVHLILEG